MNTSLKTYQHKSVLITGHTGFKGSWLCAWLKQLGAKLTGISLPPPTEHINLFQEAQIEKNLNSLFIDINSLPALKKAFAEAEPEIVFHLAAQSLVRPSYRNPSETYMTNVVGTVNVLEAARACPSVKAIIVITTDKCYKNNEWIWGYRETDELGGKDPYSASKACAELVVSSYRESILPLADHPIYLASARGGNVIGGGDWSEDRLIPDLVNALRKKKTITLRNPTATRPWQHVLELLNGYLMLGTQLSGPNAKEFASAWNFGPASSSAISVESLVYQFAQSWGNEKTNIRVIPEALPESHFLRLDASKAEAFLGWYPTLTIQESLKMTADWYKAYYQNPTKASELMTQQIKEYQRSNSNA
jgi:CDP-glucose 4,6-dehydratase